MKRRELQSVYMANSICNSIGLLEFAKGNALRVEIYHKAFLNQFLY